MDGARFFMAFKIASYAVVVLGWLGLLLTEQVGGGLWILMVFTLLFSLPEKRPLANADTFWRLMTLLFLGWMGLAWGTLGIPALELGLQLLFFLQMNRLFARRSNKDWTYIYLLSFLQILLGCILTVEPAFALVLFGFLMAGTWALLLFQLKQGMDSSREEAAPPEGLLTRLRRFVFGPIEEPPPGPAPELVYAPARAVLTSRFVLATTAVTLGMLFSTLFIFLITPRLDLAVLRHGLGTAVHVAGFSDRVELGEVGEIKLGGAKVMRIRLGGPRVEAGEPVPLYWRGNALDHFDGVRWSLSKEDRQVFLSSRGQLLNPLRPPLGYNLEQEITLEPLDTQALFVQPRVLGIQARVPAIYRSATGGWTTEPVEGRLTYTVWSSTEEPTAAELRAAGVRYPMPVQEQYFQLPEGLSPQVVQLAQQVTAGADTPYDKAQVLVDWLEKNFTYTLSPQATGGSPLEDFLFRTRSGHCEYFASAFVVMARAAGVPARLVNGFAGGSYNDAGGYWLVTQNEAHSWAEVFFPGVGWARFDPTPPAGVPGAAAEVSALAMYLDYAESLWYYYVLYYNLDVQVGFVLDMWKRLSPEGGLGAGRSGAEDPLDQGEEPGEEGAANLWLLVVALGLVAGWWVYRTRRFGAAGSADGWEPRGEGGVVRRYLAARRRLDKYLVRLGYVRGAAETPRERARRAREGLGAAAEPLLQIEERFYAHRYGGQEVTPADVERLEQARRALEAAQRR